MKKQLKNKSLKQLVIIIFTVVLGLIGYVAVPNESELMNNTLNETQTSSINETNTNIKIDDIPQYSGQIVININNDIPYFEDKDISTEDFEYYSNLDEFNRAGVAFANICKYTMPPKGTKRESLSYKPTGWNQYLYGNNNSEHLYERCHLIAWQLEMKITIRKI